MKVFILFILTLLFNNLPAQAMTVATQDEFVFATGYLNNDLKLFEEAFANPKVTTVVFVNSPGGDLWTGLRVGRLIREKKLNTVIAGYCNSACSIMFMGGKERRFASNLPHNLTSIGIHGAHDNLTNAVIPSLQPQMYAFYKEQVGEAFNAEVFNQALYQMDDAEALLHIFDMARQPEISPYHCRSKQTPKDKCTHFEGLNALNLGIITDTKLVTPNIPPNILPPFDVLGRSLANDFNGEPLDAVLTSIKENACRTDQCKNSTSQWHTLLENKSIATRTTGAGLGTSFSLATPLNAMLNAIFQCNHNVPGLPVGLCQARIINETNVQTWYDAQAQETQQALENLVVPQVKYFANEEFGGDFLQWNSNYRYEKFEDITPKELPNIHTISTQALVSFILSADKPTLIDVIGNAKTIPTSQALIRGGNAFQDLAMDQAFNARFVALLKLLAPDPQKPVVFFCAGRNCWYSVNASLRAVKAGYTNVYWYRGGINSWLSANLPTTPLVIRAVAH
jgi:rhodanese-related sulfurtransferase